MLKERTPFSDQVVSCIRQLKFPHDQEKNQDRNQDIILWAIGITSGKPQTNPRTGNEFGITRERVRQIKKSAKMQLPAMRKQYPSALSAFKFVISKKNQEKALKQLKENGSVPNALTIEVLLEIYDLFQGDRNN